MHREQEFPALISAPRKDRRAAELGIHALHKAASGLADIRRASARLKTRDLVGFLLSHGARSWRASLPPADIHIRVSSPAGTTAIRMRLK